MHEEFESFKIFAHNLRQKNQKRWGRRIVKAVRGAYDRCIILLQEVTSWEAADIDKYAIYTQRGCDCAIGVPSHLRSNVEGFHNDDCSTAIQIFGLGFVSLHLPHSGRPNDEVFDCMARISALVHSWKSKRHPLKYWILGGDLNITLPANLSPTTGGHVFNKAIKNKPRVAAVLDWLAEHSLVALNTFTPEAVHSQQAWTWENKKGARSQIDYVLVPDCFIGRAWVEYAWRIPSDHSPVCSAVSALAPLGVIQLHAHTLAGWAPESAASRADFQYACLNECRVDQHGLAADVTLASLESTVKQAAQQIPHSTSSSRRCSERVVPQNVSSAKHAWKQETSHHKRRERRKEYKALKQRPDKSRCATKLKSLSRCKVHSKSLPASLRIGPDKSISIGVP